MLRHLITAIVVCSFLGTGFLWGVNIKQIFNLQSLVIVFGGLFLAIWFSFPAERIVATWKSLKRAFRNEGEEAEDERRLLAQALGLARIYRLKGPIALQRAATQVDDDYLRYGAILVAEGYNEISLMGALQRENLKRNDLALSQVQLLKTLARLAPALGMAGTVISLMQVMQHLGTEGTLGASLGLALSSTLYGILLANLLFLPASIKLQQYFSRRADARRMVMDVLLGIQKAEHPLRIAERLNSYELYCELKEKGKSGVQVVRLEKRAA